MMTVTANQPRDDLRVRRLTIDEYHQLIETGIVSSDERVELIEGVLHQMTPKGPRYTESINSATRRRQRTTSGSCTMPAILWHHFGFPIAQSTWRRYFPNGASAR